jgi:hypothetical protein
LSSLGLPTLDITVTESSFEGVPETLEAGRYLVSVTGPADAEGASVVAFLQPFNMSAEDFFAFLGMGGGMEEGSPPAEEGDMAEASPAAEEGQEGPLPAFIYQSHFAGGASSPPGGTGSAVIDLGPGEWIVWGDDPASPQSPVTMMVTGEMPMDAPEPEADITVTLIDFGIMLDGNLTAGEHVVKVDNQGAQPHFVELSMVPDGTTNDDMTALLESFMTGEEGDSTLGEDDFTPVAYTVTQSIDVQTWTTITLETGTYAAACWFPTAGVGDPHAFHGMHTVFEVS